MKKVVFRSEVSPVVSNKTIGPARSHLYHFAIAKKMGLNGCTVQYIIECDDSDTKKHSKENFYDIHMFLVSLGIKADVHPYNSEEILGRSLFQSERGKIYGSHLERLLDYGMVSLEKNSGFAVFDVKKFLSQYGSKIEARDELLGKLTFDIEDFLKTGKKVFPLRRSDGSYLYNFSSVIDDGDLEVTHIVRGQDKIHVIPIQSMLRTTLGFPSVVYIHLPLLCDEKGKRTGGYMQFDKFLEDGIARTALMSYVLSSGYGNPDEIFLSLAEFTDKFSIQKLHKKNTKFCAERLHKINERVMRLLPPNRYQECILSYANGLKDSKEAKIMEDPDVQVFLGEFRLTPRESINLVKKIFFTEEKPPPDNTLIKCIRQIIERLRLNMEFDALFNSLSHFGKDVFAMSLRWILTRETGGTNLKKVFTLLEKKGLIVDRVERSIRIIQSINS